MFGKHSLFVMILMIWGVYGALRVDAETDQAIPFASLPAPVQAAYKKQYAAARIISVSSGHGPNHDLYEVKMEQGGKISEVSYHAAGGQYALEGPIKISELPPAVSKLVDDKYPHLEKAYAGTIVRSDVTIYEVKVKSHDGHLLEVRANSAGELIK